MPRVVARMRPSQSRSRAGRTKMTDTMLMTAPRAMSIHMEPMMSISEYSVVHRRAQLDGADADGGDEGQALS